MNGWSLAAVVAPIACYLGATHQHRGFRCQPKLVMALTRERFDTRVGYVGGPQAVRTGVWIDLGFIAVLTVPSGLLLLASTRPGLALVPAAAALVDLIEDRLLLTALRGSDAATLKWLAVAAIAKYAAYLGVLGAAWWVIWRG